MILLFAAVLIGAHVAGAVIGTQLRDQGFLHESATDSTGPISTGPIRSAKDPKVR